MQRITLGQLKVVTLERIYTFPEPSPSGEDEFDARPEVKAEIRVLKDTFWVRLCAMGGLGFAESYMYGEVECDDLISLFQVYFLYMRSNIYSANEYTWFNACSDFYRQQRQS